MEKIFNSLSLIALGFSELYLAIMDVLMSKVKNSMYKIVTPTMCVGMLVITLFITSFSTLPNTTVATKIPVPTTISSNKELATVVNESMNIKPIKYVHTSKTIITTRRPSRGGFSRLTELKLMQLSENDTTSTTTDQAIENTKSDEPKVEPHPKPDINPFIRWTKNIGNRKILTKFASLVKCGLPSDFGSRIDYSSFKPYESYRAITSRGSAAYKVTHSGYAYNDDNGFRRYYTRGTSEFTVNNHISRNGTIYGDDDYVVAMGTYYIGNRLKIGQRFLIVGENGMFTVRIGDAKADRDTNSNHMYSTHRWCGNRYAGLIEFIVNIASLESSVKADGTVDSSSVKALSGKIKAIYRINT